VTTGYTREQRRIVLAGAGAILAGLGGCWLWWSSITTQVLEDYRPDYQVESFSSDSLARSEVKTEHESVELILNWSTFDNEEFGRGPYKLRVVVRPTSEDFTAIVFDSISVSSNQRRYSIADVWPVRVDGSDQPWVEHIFEPAFPFDYAGSEIVVTRLWYRIETSSASYSRTLDLNWVPVRVEKFVPVV
jgi:hypothetical protein